MMKTIIIKLAIAFSMITQFSCQAVEDADDVANVRGGRCNLKKLNMSELQTILCFDYVDGYEASAASVHCTQLRDDYESTLSGMNGDEFTSGDSNSCESSNTVGSCDIAARGVMFYFDNFWDAGSAQSNCTSQLNGTWTP